MGPLTDLGMAENGFVGLKTLTVLQDAATLILKKGCRFFFGRHSAR